MTTSLPYLPSNKNLETLFAKIGTAKIPDKFTHDFLQRTIGLKGTNDRPFIPLLRTLGFLDSSGTPTPSYRSLKNSAAAKGTLAAAIRAAYKPLFDANEGANGLSTEKLKGLVAQVAGTDDEMTARIVSTFNSLTKLADFSGVPVTESAGEEDENEEEEAPPEKVKRGSSKLPLRPEFHYNINVHLPANGTEDVYLNIFNALRKAFQ
jgi:hypothetical protein